VSAPDASIGAQLATLSDEQRRALLRSLLQRGPSDAAGAAAPLSRGQQGLWVLQQLHPRSAAYNLAWPARVDSAVDAGALRRALRALMARHVALRTVIEERPAPGTAGGARELCQHAPATWDHLLQLRAHDARAWSEAELAAAVDAAYRAPFDLASGPTVRVDLYTRGPERHVLLLVVHHIFADAWSLQVMLRELGALYAAEIAGAPASLPELPWTPADHAAWQRGLLASAAGEALWERWRARLAGDLPVLELPADSPRPARPSLEGESATFALDPALSQAVKQLARAHGCTVFVVLLAAYFALLARYTRARDLIVGTPMAGRGRDELTGMVGYFVNLVPLRVRLEPEATVRELIAAVRTAVLEAMDDQELPFDVLVERLAPERDASRDPIIETLFEYRQPHHEGELLWLTVSEESSERIDLGGRGGLRAVGRYGLRQQEGKLDLQLEMAELPSGIAGIWKYRPAVVAPELVSQLTRHLTAILRAATTSPDQAVAALPLLDERERAALVEQGRARETLPAQAPLHTWLEARAAACPEAPAVIDRVDQITYGELNRRANRLARALVARGVQPGHRVGLCVGRSADIVVGELAILKAGAAYVPIEPTLPDDRLAFYVRDAGLALVLTQVAHAARFPAGGAAGLPLDSSDLAPELASLSDDDLRLPVRESDAAYVIYTSGSTGQPKGVVVTHRNVTRLFRVTERLFQFNSSDVWTLFHSFAFDFSVWEIWGALLYGGRLVIVPAEIARSPELVRALLVSEGVTFLNQTPSAFRELAAIDELSGGAGELALRAVVLGGEALAPATLARWVARHGDVRPLLVNMYGITETTVHVTFRALAAADVERPGPSPIGHPLADLSAYVLDERMQLAPPGVVGELYVGGDGVAREYLSRPELSAARFLPDPFAAAPGPRLYRTGDLARRSLRTGELEYVGRIDSQVKIRGYRIELGEIEQVLRAQPGVRDAVAIAEGGGTHAGGGATADYLVAYVVLADGGAAPTPAELTAAAAAALPPYMVPSGIVVLPRLPLTANGKLDRRALPPWTPGAGAAPAADPPRTPLEERLAAIWLELLPVASVARTDRFFHIGGHSLLATRAVMRVRRDLGIELPILALFESPALADFAEVVARAIAASGRDASAIAAPLATAEAPPVAASAAPAPAPPGGAPALPPIERQDRASPLPLGLAQHRLWFLDRLDRGNPVYNVPILLRLTGALDRDALARAVAAIAERHEVLRTALPMIAGQPVQRIAPAVASAALRTVDLRRAGATAEALDAEALALASADFHQSFDLEAGPLWRAQLLILGEEHHWLAVCAHHCALDGWSVAIYRAELEQLYRAATARPAAGPALAHALPLPRVQYADYAAWQRAWLGGERVAAQLAYWGDRLAGAAVVLELPTDRPRPPIQSFRGGLVPIALEPAVAAQVRAYALAERATPFMVLLAAFQLLLHRYTGQADVLVGSPIANRPHPDLEGSLGCFVNNLVLRARFDRPQCFRDLLAATRAATLGAYASQDLPFEVLVEHLKVPRDLSRNPLFQVLFALHHAPRETAMAPGLGAEAMLPDSRISKLDLSLSLVDDGAEISGYLEYASDLFDRETIAALGRALTTLLGSALADPSAPVEDLALVGPAEARALIARAAPPDERALEARTLGELFRDQVSARPDARCVVTRAGALTYAAVDARARALAAELVARGVGPGAAVGVCVSRTTDLPIALVAVTFTGAAFVPLDPSYPRDRLAYIAADAQLAVALVDAASRDALAGLPVALLDVRAASELPAAAPVAGEGAGPRARVDDAAYILYTSGSTGRPKGVAVPHRGVAALVAWSERALPDAALVGVLASTSISFDLSIFELFVTWARGGTAILEQDLLALAASPLAEEVRLVNTVPSAMLELLRIGGMPATARHVVLAGEPIRQALVDELYALGTVDAVWNAYGPTEDTVYATAARLAPSAEGADAPPAGAPPIGTAIDHHRAYVLDAARRLVPPGVPGELYLGGAGLAIGYVGQPAVTAERFVQSPFGPPGERLYRTGDLARWRSDGGLDFLGRMDSQVKLRGFRIELGEIEEVLASHPAVREAAVLLRRDGGAADSGRLVAYVATAAGGAAAAPGTDAAALRAHLEVRLPSYMVPSAYVIADRLPHTPSGKIDRRALPAPAAERPALATALARPSTAIEAEVAALWCEILGLPEVGIDDNFFDLGGHSLLITRAHAALAVRYPGRVALTDLFQHTTIRALAAHLARDPHAAPDRDPGAAARDRAALRQRQRGARRR
jgi:amino acid adenylation domain-containing protein